MPCPGRYWRWPSLSILRPLVPSTVTIQARIFRPMWSTHMMTRACRVPSIRKVQDLGALSNQTYLCRADASCTENQLLEINMARRVVWPSWRVGVQPAPRLLRQVKRWALLRHLPTSPELVPGSRTLVILHQEFSLLSLRCRRKPEGKDFKIVICLFLSKRSWYTLPVGGLHAKCWKPCYKDRRKDRRTLP